MMTAVLVIIGLTFGFLTFESKRPEFAYALAPAICDAIFYWAAFCQHASWAPSHGHPHLYVNSEAYIDGLGGALILASALTGVLVVVGVVNWRKPLW